MAEYLLSPVPCTLGKSFAQFGGRRGGGKTEAIVRRNDVKPLVWFDEFSLIPRSIVPFVSAAARDEA